MRPDPGPAGRRVGGARAPHGASASFTSCSRDVSVVREMSLSLAVPFQKGFTPLHVAAKYGSLDVAKLLLHRRVAADSAGKVQPARRTGWGPPWSWLWGQACPP